MTNLDFSQDEKIITPDTIVSANLKQSNVTTIDPDITNDDSEGYEIQSRWYNTVLKKEFICLDASTGAAVWIETTVSTETSVVRWETSTLTGISHTLTVDDEQKIILLEHETSPMESFTIRIPDALLASVSDFRVRVQTKSPFLGIVRVEYTSTPDQSIRIERQPLSVHDFTSEIILNNSRFSVLGGILTTEEVTSVDAYEQTTSVMLHEDSIFSAASSRVQRFDISPLAYSDYFSGSSGGRGIEVDATHCYTMAIGYNKVFKIENTTMALIQQPSVYTGLSAIAQDSTSIYAISVTGSVYNLDIISKDTGSVSGPAPIAVVVGEVSCAAKVDNELFVTNPGNDRIMILNASTAVIESTYGTTGSGNDEFNNPTEIRIVGSEYWVLDRGNSRIKRHRVNDNTYVGKLDVDPLTVGFDYDLSSGMLVFSKDESGTIESINKEYRPLT